MILISGAGPSGLVLALWLRKKSVPFRIIDKSKDPGETSRAVAVQSRTLEFYRQLGIDQKVIAEGTTADQIRLRRRGKLVATAEFGAVGAGLTPFPYLLFYPQDVHEQLLCRELAALGVEVERETELMDFADQGSAVEVRLKGPKGKEKLKVDYLCGCDGAHSAVRHGLGIGFPGGTYSQVFFVADVLARGEMAEGGVQISVSTKDFCIVMPVRKKGSVRLTGIVPPESEKKEKITFADVAESVRLNTGLEVDQANWFSTYHVHHRVADTFGKGRVFLVGDAGHIHSPAGGQGMNTGIGDAVNLAWKLAEVVQGKAPPSLLETYETERIAFARVLVKSTDTAFKFIAARSKLGSVFRAYMLPEFFARLIRLRPVLHLAYRTISQLRIKYRHSTLSAGRAGDVYGGDRLPWVKDNFTALQSLEWQVHIYGQIEKGFRRAVEELKLPLHGFRWSEACARQGLLRDAFYLVRPDGHVALASDEQDISRLRDYLAKNFGK